MFSDIRSNRRHQKIKSFKTNMIGSLILMPVPYNIIVLWNHCIYITTDMILQIAQIFIFDFSSIFKDWT